MDPKKQSYQELDKSLDECIKKLQDDSLPLDEAQKVFIKGKEIFKRMEERIEELTNEVKDTIKDIG